MFETRKETGRENRSIFDDIPTAYRPIRPLLSQDWGFAYPIQNFNRCYHRNG